MKTISNMKEAQTAGAPYTKYCVFDKTERSAPPASWSSVKRDIKKQEKIHQSMLLAWRKDHSE